MVDVVQAFLYHQLNCLGGTPHSAIRHDEGRWIATAPLASAGRM
jgi:hypothetical protein